MQDFMIVNIVDIGIFFTRFNGEQKEKIVIPLFNSTTNFSFHTISLLVLTLR